MRRSILALCLLAALLPLGCGKPADPVEIGGKVLNLEEKRIVLFFHPQDDANRANDSAMIRFDPKTGEISGKALPGKYKITVAPIARRGEGPAGVQEFAEGKTEIPPQLLDVKRTPLSVEIPAEGKRNLLITLPF